MHSEQAHLDTALISHNPGCVRAGSELPLARLLEGDDGALAGEGPQHEAQQAVGVDLREERGVGRARQGAGVGIDCSRCVGLRTAAVGGTGQFLSLLAATALRASAVRCSWVEAKVSANWYLGLLW